MGKSQLREALSSMHIVSSIFGTNNRGFIGLFLKDWQQYLLIVTIASAVGEFEKMITGLASPTWSLCFPRRICRA